MQRLILALSLAGLATVPAAAREEWRHVGKDSGGYNWHVDVASIRDVSPFIYVWTLADLPADSSKDYYPARRLMKIDCANNLYKFIQLVAYERVSGKVHEVQNWPDTPGTADFKTPKTDGIMDTVIAYSCMTG